MLLNKKQAFKSHLRYFDSNEVLLTNAKVNSYDLIIPSDYAIEELASRGYYLKPLDWDRLILI